MSETGLTNYMNYMNYPLIYNNRYSTDEQVVGIWIDGKPIYRRVFTCKIPENLPIQPTYIAYKYYNFNEMDTVVHLEGMLVTDDGTVALSYVISGKDVSQVYISRKYNQFGVLIGKVQISQNLKHIHIVVDFTKVSDVATITPPIILTNVYTGKQEFDFVNTGDSTASVNYISNVNGVNSIGSDVLNIETAKEITE